MTVCSSRTACCWRPGRAPIEWIETSVRLAPVIPGVARFDASRLVDAALEPLAAAIEAAMPMFVKGSTAFARRRRAGRPAIRPGGSPSLDALGRAAERRFAVELVGEADADGAAEANLPLSEHRAARVLAMLQSQRLERVTLTATWHRQPPAADPARGRSQQTAQPPRVVPCQRRRRFGDNPADMLHNKICMLGGFGVGKTSLVSRFVSSIFSDTLPHHRGREDRQEDGDRSIPGR